MLELYPEIRWAHIAAVMLSGALFAFRGTFIAMGATWPMIAPLRFSSYGIDTILVATAISLLIILPSEIYANGWLALKLTLLVIYVVLGSLAFKRGRTRGIRRAAFAAAIVVFLAMFSIARTHDPLGPWIVVRSWMT